jgi:hypothetical protein
MGDSGAMEPWSIVGIGADGVIDSGAVDSGAIDSGPIDSGAIDWGAIDCGAIVAEGDDPDPVVGCVV